ncbi:hypothetical protein AB4851_08395 [Burkholderia sp. 22PA0099]|uniref:hypothetical protein n=1 Tax=Burkholderia sp. 22PA0099 TaxID=3237372 RepID=UPI0039C2A28D
MAKRSILARVRSIFSHLQVRPLVVGHFLGGIGLGIAVMTLPPTILDFSWQARALSLVVKFSTILEFAGIAVLAGAAAKWAPWARRNLPVQQFALSAAQGVCTLSMNAASFLLGLSCVIAFSHDGHALSVMLNAAIWFVALRQFVLEQASGKPRTRVVAACVGWMAGVTFQANIAHAVAVAAHHI